MNKAQMFIKSHFANLEKSPNEPELKKVFRKLYEFFGRSKGEGFDLKRLDGLDDEWRKIALQSIEIYYTEDFYGSAADQPVYINMHDVARILQLDICTLNKRLRKGSYKIPKPDHFVSGDPVWVKSEVRKFRDANGIWTGAGDFTYPKLEE
ncbi:MULTISPECIES: hypothetical protein [Bacillus]|uniref:hypothetical protein n=1 Tax=Bacillus TaxID=1386 RepID=UPI00090B79CF|nr:MULTISPECIES: hypothetical protein [Bacillus]APJ13365.1 hypothetical protein BSL056_20430 [Bacillus safensis]ATH74496.1 hypothetical protein CFN77_19855 [Bacillus altitudinis]